MDFEIDYDDEDIGLELPPVSIAHELLANQEAAQVAAELEEAMETETGFPELDRITPPPILQSDTRDPNKQLKDEFKIFREELIFTLASKYTGYSDLHELRNDLAKDSGFSPEMAAQKFGFPNFEAMMNSDKMKNIVQVMAIEGKICYLPRDFSRFEHIRSQQEITQNQQMLNMDDMERDKIYRSQLPQNRDAAIKGRQKISEILYELEGHKKPVLWQEIQKKYREKYGVELAGQELRNMFQRDKALSIIHTLFEKEVETYDANMPGQFYLKLKVPYNELQEYYKDQLKTHSEAKAIVNRGRYGPKMSSHRPKDIYPVGPMLPTNVDQFLDQMPSTSAAAGIRPLSTLNGPSKLTGSVTPPTQPNVAKPSLPIPNNSQSSKSKFDMPDFASLPKPKPSLNERLNAMMDDSSQEEMNPETRFQWNETEAYVPPGPGQDGIEERNGRTGNVNGNKPPPAKKRYTDCARNDMTDSDEGDDDADEDAASIVPPITLGGTRPVVRASQSSMANKNGPSIPAFSLPSNSTSTNANDENMAPIPLTTTTMKAPIPLTTTTMNIPLTYHQRNIQNHMVDMMANKKNKTTAANPHISSTTPMPAPTPQQSAMKSHQQQPQRNVAFNNQNMDDSSDEDDETGLEQYNNNQMRSSAQSMAHQPHHSGGPSHVAGGLHPSQNQIGTTPSRANPFQLSANSVQSRSSSFATSILLNPVMPTADWALLDYVEAMRALANQMRLSHESRPDEGSFTFRNGSILLVFAEFDDKIRASKHTNGYIQKERYYPKVDWEMFLQTVRGIISETFSAGSSTARAMFDDGDEADNSCGWNCPPSARRCTRWGECSALANQQQQQRAEPVAENNEDSFQWDESDGWGRPPAESALNTSPPLFRYREQNSAANNNNQIWGQSSAAENVGDGGNEQQNALWGCPPSKDAVANYEERPVPRTMVKKEQRIYDLKKVPNEFESFEPPYPAYCTTVDGRDFLAFFTKIYGFSNHYATEFKIDGISYCCSEQFYMHFKALQFGFNAAAEEIMATTNSSKIKELGTADTLRMRQACGLEPGAGTFDHDEWRRIKPEVMMRALRAKFNQNAFLCDMLIRTDQAYLVEASASDLFWGIGCNLKSEQICDPGEWRGGNQLGRLLMQLRTELQQPFIRKLSMKKGKPKSSSSGTGSTKSTF